MNSIPGARGHVNGARYIVTRLGERVIEAKIATGPFANNTILIPRIIFKPEDKTIPFEFQRRQFPIKVSFAMTSNKSQGQTFRQVGIHLKEDMFTHGQVSQITDILIKIRF